MPVPQSIATSFNLIYPLFTGFGRRAFSVAGPMVWNSLPDFLRDTSLCEDTFRRSLKTYFFCVVLKHVSALEALRNALYKFSTYLLTYFINTKHIIHKHDLCYHNNVLCPSLTDVQSSVSNDTNDCIGTLLLLDGQ